MLDAIRHHTIGDPAWARTGRALYMADFLEPGRTFARADRAFLAAQVPHDFEGVFRQVVRARIEWALREGHAVFEPDDHALEPAPVRLRAIVVGAALAVGLAAGRMVLVGADARAGRRGGHAPTRSDRAHARCAFACEVLNATRIRGLARRGTFLLRDRGFDVVAIGTSSQQSDSTLVLDRTNHPEWARRVARALGGARVEARPDSTLYVDVTVLLGRAWRPPPEPLHP